MKSIAIDMDNVIADIETHFIDQYELKFGVRVPKENLHGIHESEAFPDKDAIMRFLFTPGFFRGIPVMPGAQEALKKLSEKYEIYIVSAAMQFPQSLSEKQEWLGEHFPWITWHNIVFCGDKSKIGTDFMIDDHMRNLDTFRGKGYLYTASHNALVEGYNRIHNWDEAMKIFL